MGGEAIRVGDRYPGNQKKGVSKTARYSITADGKVRLVYPIDHRDRALLTTEEHPALVRLVNDLREDMFGRPGGSFVINEFQHVLVPDGKGHAYLAGQYREMLEFAFDGQTISPVAPAGLNPGDTWSGPRVGIKYVIAAGGRDVYYEYEPRPQVLRKVKLSDEIGAAAAARLIKDVLVHKREGGGLYINEAGEFFAPIQQGEQWVATYLGSLGDRDWFPEPAIVS